MHGYRGRNALVYSKNLEREFELAKTAARGATHLIIGKILSKVVSTIGLVILIRLLKPEGYGLLNVAIVAPEIFALFTGFGVDAAITKSLAECKDKGEFESLKSFMYPGLIFRVFMSLLFTFLCFALAEVFATNAIGKPFVAPLIRIASLLVLAWTLDEFSKAVFLGIDTTKAYVITMLLFEALKASLPIAFIIYGMSVLGALYGMAIAMLISGSIAISVSILLVSRMVKSSRRTSNFQLSKLSSLKMMIKYGTPLMMASFANNVASRYYSFMIAVYCISSEIGLYNTAGKVVVAITFLTDPIASVLFPAFSKISPKKEPGLLEKALKYSIKYSSLFILPAITLMIILSRPIVVLLFGIEFEDAWLYLALMALGSLDYGLGHWQLRRLLIAQGETPIIAKIEVLNAIIGIFLGFILIPHYGILGVILITLILIWPSLIIVIKKAYSLYRVKPPFPDIWRLYTSIATMILVTLPLTMVALNVGLKIAVISLVGLLVYILATLLTKTIRKSDIDALIEIFKPQPLIGTIVSKTLKIIKKYAF